MHWRPSVHATLLVAFALIAGAFTGCLAATTAGSSDEAATTGDATAPVRYLLAEFPDDPGGEAGNVMTPSVHQDGGRIVGAVDDPATDTIHLGTLEDGNVTRERIPIGHSVQQLRVVTWHDRTFLAYRTPPDPGGSQSIVLVYREDGTWQETAVATDRVGSGVTLADPMFRSSAIELLFWFGRIDEGAVSPDGLASREVLRLTAAVTSDGLDLDAVQHRRFDDGLQGLFVDALAVHDRRIGYVSLRHDDDLVYAEGRWEQENWPQTVIHDDGSLDTLQDGTEWFALAYDDNGQAWVRRTPKPYNTRVETGDSYQVFLSHGPDWNWTATSLRDGRRFGAEADNGSMYLSAYDSTADPEDWYSINRWNGTGATEPLLTAQEEWRLVENATGPMTYTLTGRTDDGTRRLWYAPDAGRLSSG